MKFYLQGQPRPATDAAYSEVGFSRAASGGPLAYVLELDRAEFIARMQPAYDECVRELERDDAITGEPHAYPPLADLVTAGAHTLFEFIDTHLRFDLLGAYFDEYAMPGDSPIALLSLDRLEMVGDSLRLHGRAAESAPVAP